MKGHDPSAVMTLYAFAAHATPSFISHRAFDHTHLSIDLSISRATFQRSVAARLCRRLVTQNAYEERVGGGKTENSFSSNFYYNNSDISSDFDIYGPITVGYGMRG